MISYIVHYWIAGKHGYYFLAAENKQKAKELFYYTHPEAQLLNVEEH